MTSTGRLLIEQDFEECFTGEPAVTDLAADLGRGRARLRRNRTLAASASAGAAAVVVVLALVVVSGLWTHGVEAVPAAGPAPVPDERTFLMPPDANQRIFYATIRSDPLPTPAPQPPVSSADAISKSKAGGPTGTPTATLRMISAPGGLSGIPTSPEPYWVINWANTPPGYIGGPAMPNKKAQEDANQKRAEEQANLICGDVTFVNASTGRQVNGIWHLCTRR